MPKRDPRAERQADQQTDEGCNGRDLQGEKGDFKDIGHGGESKKVKSNTCYALLFTFN
jgi:hypothetical protein